MKRDFLLNWNDRRDYRDHGQDVKFKIGDNDIEVSVFLMDDTIFVACSNMNTTKSKTWKEKGVSLDQIKEEIDLFLSTCEKELK